MTSPKQNAIEFGITPIGLKLEYDQGSAGGAVSDRGHRRDVHRPRRIRAQRTVSSSRPSVGAGIELFLTDQLAMSFSWRIRHISNAGIEQPIRAQHAAFVMVGFDWFPKR